MHGAIRARVKHGMLELLERIDLPEGAELPVTILHVPSGADREAFRRAAGGWQGTVNAEALLNNIYADRLISTRPAPRLYLCAISLTRTGLCQKGTTDSKTIG